MIKRPNWPPIKIRQVPEHPLEVELPTIGLHQQIDYFWFLQKWNGGMPLEDAFPIQYEGRKMVGRVKHFYGVNAICSAILSTWDNLPRGSIPIGDIDIEDREFDISTLLTFCGGPNNNKLFLFSHPHDGGLIVPEDPANLIHLANSLPVFLRSLKSYDELYYRTFLELKTTPLELPTITMALTENGLDEFYDADYTQGKNSTVWSAHWEDYHAEIVVGHSTKKIGDIAVPSSVSGTSRCFLAIDACHWDQTAALKAVKHALKSVPAFKGAKKAGETPARPEPYWRSDNRH